MRKNKNLKKYDYKGWLVEQHPNSFAEIYAWSAQLLNVEGYREEFHGFNTESGCRSFVDSVESEGA